MAEKLAYGSKMEKIIQEITPASNLVPAATAREVCEYNVSGLSSAIDQLSFSNDTASRSPATPLTTVSRSRALIQSESLN